MMHALMAAQSKTKKATVSQWCRVLGVCRSGWYAAQQRQRCTRQSSMLSIQAKAAFDASGQNYGSRRLSAALRAANTTQQIADLRLVLGASPQTVQIARQGEATTYQGLC